MILQYAEEALETIAANTAGKFGKLPEGPVADNVQPLSNLLKPDLNPPRQGRQREDNCSNQSGHQQAQEWHEDFVKRLQRRC